MSRIATAIRDLHPGYFAFVMATGIISTGTFLLGLSWLSRALLAAALIGLVVLSAALMLRLAMFRSCVAADIPNPERGVVAREGCKPRGACSGDARGCVCPGAAASGPRSGRWHPAPQHDG